MLYLETLTNANLLLVNCFFKLGKLFQLDSLSRLDLFKQISLFRLHLLDVRFFLDGLALNFHCLAYEEAFLSVGMFYLVALDHPRTVMLIFDSPSTHHLLSQILDSLIHNLLLVCMLVFFCFALINLLALITDSFTFLSALGSDCLLLHVFDLLVAQHRFVLFLALHLVDKVLLVHFLDGFHLGSSGPSLVNLFKDAFLLVLQQIDSILNLDFVVAERL